MIRPRAALLVVVSTLLATSAAAGLPEDRLISAEVDRNAVVRTRGNVEVHSLDGSLSAPSVDELTSIAAKGAADIAHFTGVRAPRRIVIYLSPRVNISHTYPHYPASDDHAPRLFIDTERVANHSAPYLHELVHAVVGNGGAMWLEEGFASWVASSVATQSGGYYAPVLSDDNSSVDAQARAALERTSAGSETSAWFASVDGPDFATQRERRSFYIAAHSFTKFLAQSLGTRELVRIHRRNDVHSLARLSGVSIGEWERRWRNTLGEGATRVSLSR